MDLFAWFRKKASENPSEADRMEAIHNPLGLTAASRIKPDVLDFRGESFRLASVIEYAIEFPNRTERIVDYELQRAADETCRLRVIEGDGDALFPYRTILMILDDARGYHEDLEAVIRNENGCFEVNDGKEQRAYYRPNANPEGRGYEPLLQTVVANVSVLQDENRDGMVSESEVETGEVEIWDFSRRAEIEGVETDEFVYVQMDRMSGWFEFWLGREIRPSAVEVF